MIEEKKCRGTGKAKGNGCGKLIPVSLYGKSNRVYGLGKSCQCYSKWLLNTELGQQTLEKARIVGKNKAVKAEKKKNREETAQQRIDLMSPDKYRAKYIQPLINKIARLIDHGNPCIATGNFEGKMAGGHYTSVGSNRTICLNLHNIFIQSFQSNSWNGGDDKRYRESLKNTFGEDYLDFIEGLKAHRPIKLTKDDLVEIKKKATGIIKDLENNKAVLSSRERISMRNSVNLELGIYENQFNVFKL
jgi:hypothetical protein